MTDIGRDVRNLVHREQTVDDNLIIIGRHIESVNGWLVGDNPPPSAHHSDEVAELRRELAESKSVIDQYSLDVKNMFVEHRTALLKLNTIETTTDLDLTDLKNRFNQYTKNLEKDLDELRDQVRILASDVDDKA